jgi:F-type H+-transporting ATPase subunit b
MADEHSTHTETGHGGGGHGAFPPFQPDAFASQIVWLALTFGALYFLMSRVALPRVGAILAQRKDSIGSQLDAAAAMQAKAKEASDAHDKSIAEAKSKAQALAQASRDQLAAQSDASRKSLESELGAKLATAEAQIAETTARAMANVDAIASEAAGAIVERLTGKATTPDVIASAIAAAKQA